MLSKGQKINDRYEIIKTIGEGGMANVYLANDTILDRKVAIKVLRGDLSNDEKFIRRFKREALSVSNLSHPNIVEVYDVGEEDGNYYIVMEYIEGKTLKQLLQKRGALTLNEVIDIMTQLTDGLAHAHEAYIIHRDIKPQNIMIEDNGLVKITDFGIAMALNSTQLTQTNSVMGSVHYLPPEQANGKGSTVKSDIYSLGILMYELLTGSVPFKGDTAVEIALKHMKEKIPSIRKQNPTIPQSVENIVLKATAKNPKNRYDNVRDMYKDLQTALQRDNEKRLVYEYPENDLEETKVIPQVTKEIKQVIDKPTAKEEDSEDNSVLKEKDEKNKLPIILAVVLLGTLIVLAGVYLLITSKDVKEVKVPNVVGLTTEKAIKMIKSVGGVPVLAHPVLYHMGNDQMNKLMDYLCEHGIAGLEAVYSTYTMGDELEMKHIAKERNLLISGGSDYHGANKPDIELGTGRGHLFVPEEILTKIKEYKNNI